METSAVENGPGAPQGAEAALPDLQPANHVAASTPPAAALGAADVPQQAPAAAAATPVPAQPAAAGDAAGQAASAAAVTPPGEASGAKPRAQKTPYQKEALEAAYKLNSLPTEEMKRVLGEKIGLTEQQVSTWFSHRRRKDRKEAADAALAAAGGAAPAAAPAEAAGATPALAAQPAAAAAAAAAAVAAHAGDVLVSAAGSEDEDGDDYEDCEPDAAELERLAEMQELLELAKTTLGVEFRKDGPPLGFEFDEIPLGPRKGGSGEAKRRRGEDDPDFEFGPKRQRSAPRAKLVLSGGDLGRLQAEEEQRAVLLAEKARITQERLEMAIKREQERLLREKERTDVRVAREREREIQRLEAERKKHLEKMLRDQKKEEERKLKEAARLRQLQEKEQRKLLAQLEKEKKQEERKRQQEEKKKEKEMLKTLQQQERNAMRLRARPGGEAGPKDDADWEWEALVAAYRQQHGLPTDEPLPAEGASPPREGLPPLPSRPAFPPPSVHLAPAFPPEVGDRPGGELLMSWSFLHSFGDLIGVKPCTIDQLLAAVAAGPSSPLLSSLHIGLLRLLQADAEEAHAVGAAGSHAEQSQAAAAQLLEEGWAWGFDVDVWRAHLNALTWPEVARQLAIAAGLGRKRPKPRKEEKPKLGQEGEDIVVDEQGGLKLKLPPRLAVGSVKAAAWQVLAEAGPEGMRVEEIARRIQKLGLRDLRSSRTPEASVAGALGRDVLFARVAPATYALQAILAYHTKLAQQAEQAQQGQQEEGGGAEAGPEGQVKPEAEGSGSGGAEAQTAQPMETDAGGAGGQQQQQQQQQGGGAAGAPKAEPGSGGAAVKAEPGSRGAAAAAGAAAAERPTSPTAAAAKIEVVKSEPDAHQEHGGEDHEEDESEDEEEDKHDSEEEQGAPWVRALEGAEYDQLAVEHRIGLLAALCDCAMAGPTVRDMLERRLEEQQRIKKQMWEENKAEKRRKQVEAAAKAKAAAEEAAKALEKYKAAAGAVGSSEGGSANPGPAAPGTANGAVTREGSSNPEGAPAAATAREGAAEGGQGQQQPAAAATTAAAAAAAAAATPVPKQGSPGSTGSGGAAGGATPAGAAAAAAAGVGTPAGEGGGLVDPHEAAAMAIAAAEKQLVKVGESEEEKAAAKARQAARAEAVRRDLEAAAVRLEALGSDRRHNKYWRFVVPSPGSAAGAAGAAGGGAEPMDVDGGAGPPSEAEDPSAGRVFFESGEDGSIRLICTAEDFEALLAALERRGAREGLLCASLTRCRDAITRAMPAAPLSLPPAPSADEALSILEERANALMACMPVGALEVAGASEEAEDLTDENAELLHLKAGLLMVVAALPHDALPPPFDGASWRAAVREAGSALELRGSLGRLEEAIGSDYLSPAFHRRPLLVKGAWLPTGNEVASALPGSTAADLVLPDAAAGAAAAVAAAGGLALAGPAAGGAAATAGGAEAGNVAGAEPLAWLPATTAAVGLRLLALDASLFYKGGAAPARERLEAYKYIQRPAPPEAGRGTVAGLPISAGGRVKPSLFPPFPGRLLFGPRVEFTFPVAQFQKDWATGSSATVAAKPKVGVGKGRGRR